MKKTFFSIVFSAGLVLGLTANADEQGVEISNLTLVEETTADAERPGNQHQSYGSYSHQGHQGYSHQGYSHYGHHSHYGHNQGHQGYSHQGYSHQGYSHYGHYGHHHHPPHHHFHFSGFNGGQDVELPSPKVDLK